MRTSPPISYIPPTVEEIRAAAQEVGLRSFSRDLVTDLSNLAAGGNINPPSSYREEVARRVDDNLRPPEKRLSRKNTYHDDGWWLRSGTFTTRRQEIVAEVTEDHMRYHRNVSDFLASIEPSAFPGDSPLAKAMSILKLLSTQQGGQGGGEDGEPLPIFQECEHPEKVGKKILDAVETAESLSDVEKEMLDMDSDLTALKVAEDMVDGKNKRVVLEVSRKLDQISKLQVRKQIRLEADPAGEEVHQRPIKSLNELYRINQSAWALRQKSPTLFLYNAVTHNIPVRERVTRQERKQALFILLDGSGSMSQGQRHYKASGVVMNRLKAVISGDAEVFLSVFDDKMGSVKSARTPEEARELMKKFTTGNYSGGGTDIAASVRAAHKYIQDRIDSGSMLYRPEIVVLTDDDLSIESMVKSDIPGTVVHGFAMDNKNQSLVAFARSTGGVGFDNF